MRDAVTSGAKTAFFIASVVLASQLMAEEDGLLWCRLKAVEDKN